MVLGSMKRERKETKGGRTTSKPVAPPAPRSCNKAQGALSPK
jgi:hypothetical protein